MPEFNHVLLSLARLHRGKSQSDVAVASGLNQGHYSRIENGLLPDGPSSENAQRIASVLDFPVSFFYQPDDVAGLPLSVHPMHRKKASVGERALKQIHAELNLRLIHIRRYLTAVDLETELPLPWLDVDEAGGPAEVARLIRKSWMIPDGPIRNLTDCCERAGILVIWCDFSAPIDGVAMRVRDLPACIFLNRRVTADRMRFSLAHELGHIIMHRVPTDHIEEEASAFAGELLVPQKDFVRQAVGNRFTLEFLARQKAYWNVSMAFLLYRANRIGLISRNQNEYLWKQISGLGWKTREPQETDLPFERPTLFPNIVRLHSHNLGYGAEELSGLLHSHVNDLRLFYGEHLKAEQPRLRLIK